MRGKRAQVHHTRALSLKGAAIRTAEGMKQYGKERIEGVTYEQTGRNETAIRTAISAEACPTPDDILEK